MTERKAIKSAREAAGKTQSALAAECGVTRWTINQIETGHRAPSAALIGKIVKALNGAITPNDFFEAPGRAHEESGAAA